MKDESLNERWFVTPKQEHLDRQFETKIVNDSMLRFKQIAFAHRLSSLFLHPSSFSLQPL